MKQVFTVDALPRNDGEKFQLMKGHKITGCYARNGYPDGIYEELPDDTYQVVAQWDNQLMIAVCSEDDSFCSSKHRYVIRLD